MKSAGAGEWRGRERKTQVGVESFHRAVWLLPGDHILLPLRFLFLSKGVGFPGEPVTSTFPNFHPTFLKSYLQID